MQYVVCLELLRIYRCVCVGGGGVMFLTAVLLKVQVFWNVTYK
jgi:hypothetical protein